MQTTGDDWPLFKMDIKTKEEGLNYFIKLSNRIEKGQIGGIGFHPWILYSNRYILEAFEEFLRLLDQQDDVRIETAKYFYTNITTRSNENDYTHD